MGSLPPRGVCELSVAQRSRFVHLCQPGKKPGVSRDVGEETWLDRASVRVLYGTLLGGVWSPRDHLAPATAGKPMAAAGMDIRDAAGEAGRFPGGRQQERPRMLVLQR